MKILGFGAILWDRIENKLNIGGAVFNVIAHCRQLGWDTYLASSLGKDDLGRKATDILEGKDIRTNLLKKVDIPTCIVEVRMDQNREPQYYLDNPTSWDFIDINPEDIKLINKIKFDYFCFGTIEMRGEINSTSLRTILENCSFKNIFFDLNLRLDYFNKSQIEYYLKKCNMLKLNMAEFKILIKAFGIDEYEYKKILSKLAILFDIKIICLTMGDSGAYAYSDGDLVQCQGYSVKVRNTVGSGDAFSAAFMTGINQGMPLKEACDFACRMGAFVATAKGALPDYNLDNINKILDLNIRSAL